MSTLALGLVLASAVTHAGWNLLAKRAEGGAAFVWLFSALGSIIYLPLALAVVIIQQAEIGLTGAVFLGGTCILHLAYYFALSKGYRAGDLSLVYPLSRGLGPALAAIGAIILLGERPAPLAIIGMMVITAGVFVLTGNPFRARQSGSGAALAYGLLTAAIIAAYTLWDKQVVGALMIPPLILTWVSNTVRALVLTPVALRQPEKVRQAWRSHRREAISISILDSLSYILFLIALSFSPVSYLAPARQSSIVIGALMGTWLLSEGHRRQRLVATGIMLVGLVALTLA